MKKKEKELLRLVCKLRLKQKEQPWITLETTKFLIIRTIQFWRERGSNPLHWSGISSSADKTDVARLPVRAQDCSQQKVSSAKSYPKTQTKINPTIISNTKRCPQLHLFLIISDKIVFATPLEVEGLTSVIILQLLHGPIWLNNWSIRTSVTSLERFPT